MSLLIPTGPLVSEDWGPARLVHCSPVMWSWAPALLFLDQFLATRAHLSSCRSCTSSRRQSTTSSCCLHLLRSSLPTRSHNYPRRLGHRSRPADGPFPSAAWPLLSGGRAKLVYRGGVLGVGRVGESSRTLFCSVLWTRATKNSRAGFSSLLLENICFRKSVLLLPPSLRPMFWSITLHKQLKFLHSTSCRRSWNHRAGPVQLNISHLLLFHKLKEK